MGDRRRRIALKLSLLAIVMAVLSCSSCLSKNSPSRKTATNATRKSKPEVHTMGTDVTLSLFDHQAYDNKVVPALERYLEDNDPKGSLELLREIVSRYDDDFRYLTNPILYPKSSLDEYI